MEILQLLCSRRCPLSNTPQLKFQLIITPSLFSLPCQTQLTHSESESELIYDWRFAANHFVMAPSPLEIILMNPCGHRPYVTSYLTRRLFCNLQLLLALTSAVILGFESRWTHGHILLSQTRDSLNLEGQVPVFISPRSRVAQLYPQAVGSLFVASYDSQGYGGGIRTRFHTRFNSTH
jgi:hypothetical protein